METLLNVCLGMGLAAACGFRVFVPLLVLNLAARSGYVALSGGFEWMAGTPALITFGVATLLEIAAYYIPWLDNLLDTVATPAAVVAGIVAAASVIGGIDPYLKWTLAAIAGGAAATAVQGVTVGLRHLASLGTGGLGNPILSTVEAGGSLALSALSLALPLAAAALVVILVFAAWRLLSRRRRRTAAA